MKLLDENLSHRLVASVASEFPGSQHVRDLGLRGQSDQRIWEAARENGFVVVTKDSDFRQRSFVDGSPPNVVWLDVGNDGTAAIARLLARSGGVLRELGSEPNAALLVLSKIRNAS